MKCAACGETNRRDATFCLGCGEPLALGNAEWAGLNSYPTAAAPAAVAGQAADWRWLDPRRWGWELRLTVLLLLTLLGGDLYWQGQQQDESSYSKAQKLLAGKDWQRAQEALQPLAEKKYKEAASLYLSATNTIAAVASDYNQGERLLAAGQSLWLAAYYYRRAVEEWPGYQDTAAKLTALRQQLSPFVYRIATGEQAGLYLAEGDGGLIARLPQSDAGSSLYEIAAGLILYGNSANGVSDFYLYNVGSGKVGHFSVGSDQQDRVAVAIFSGGKAVAAVVGGFGGGPRAQANLRRLYCFYPSNGVLQTVAAAQIVAQPRFDDRLLYYSSAERRYGFNGTMLINYEPIGELGQYGAVRWVRETVNRLLLADGGRQLLLVSYRDSKPTLLALNSDGSGGRSLYTLPDITATGFSTEVIDPLVSPDGSLVLFKLDSGGPPTFYLHDLTNGETWPTQMVTTAPGTPFGSPAAVRFGPAGQQIMVSRPATYQVGLSGESRQSDLYLYDRGGSLVRQLTLDDAHIGSSGFLPGGFYYYAYAGSRYQAQVIWGALPARPLLDLALDSRWQDYPLTLLNAWTVLAAGKGPQGVGVYALGPQASTRLVAGANAVWPLNQAWHR